MHAALQKGDLGVTRRWIYGSRSKGRHKAYATESLFKLSAKVFSRVRESICFFGERSAKESIILYGIHAVFRLEAMPSSSCCCSCCCCCCCPATATTTTTTTSYYSSSCCCHWLLRCAPRNPPMTPQFLAKDSRKFRESIGECEGLFCGPLPKPSSDRPSKT